MKCIQLLICIFLPVTLDAQTSMKLNDCIRLAWEQYPGLKNGAIHIQEAHADYVASIGDFLPRINLKGTAGKRYGRSIDPATNGYVNRNFEEGTIGLDMTFSLFEGFSRINKMRFLKINKECSEWKLKEERNELAYLVTEAYYKLLLEEKLLNISQEQSRLSERYLKKTEAFVEIGLKSVSDLQEVKARCDGDAFRYSSRKNSYRMALLQLKQLMNLMPTDTLVIQDEMNEEQLPVYTIPQENALYSQSVLVQPSMKMAGLSVSAARKRYAMEKGKFFPSVYLCFSAGSNFYNTTFSSRQLRDNIGKYIGFGISFPLLSGLERITTLRKQNLNIDRVRNEEELQKQKLYANVEQTVLSLRAGSEEFLQALQQVRAESLVLKESERKWEEGLISIFQLMEARNRYITSKAELTRVRLQLEITIKLEHYYRTGTFLQE